MISAILLLVAGACNMVNTSDGPGRLVVKITDDPFDISNIESATVTITKIQIKKVCDGVCDSDAFVTLSEDTLVVDLIDLRNGVTQTLLDLEIPEGDYDMLRLYVDEAGLKVKDVDDPYSLKVPSGSQSGIKVKIDPAVTVAGGLSTDLLIDFDLSRSFVLRGNMNNNNGFIFKPVIRATNLTTTGTIGGMVSDTSRAIVKEAKVWLTQDTVMATTFADTLGRYAIIGVPAGEYSVSSTKDGYDTVTFQGVNIIAGNKTTLDFVLTKK